MSSPSHETIAVLAYKLYDEEGRPEGRAETHWYKALEILAQTALPSDPRSGPDALHQHINMAIDRRLDEAAIKAMLKTVRGLEGVEKVGREEDGEFMHIFYDPRRTNPAAIFDAIEASRKSKDDAEEAEDEEPDDKELEAGERL